MSETIVITETVVEVVEIGAPGVPGPPGADGGGAPDTADYLVGTTQASLSAEIVVGASPGGELGGTWAAPTVDATHSGSSHAATQAAAEATAAAALAAHLAADVIDGDAAGGVLAGTFPNPGFAADMATQAELNAVAAAGVTDHGALTGLGDNDHPQYQLASGAATDAELAAAIAGLSAVYQPVDSDLTALAALTTTSFGRGLLELANQAALLSAAGAAAASHAHSGADITSGTVAEARIHGDIARDSEVTSAISALSSVYQPLDSDLTAIAALTTTAFGRSVLEAANAAALRTLAGLAIGTDVPGQAAFDDHSARHEDGGADELSIAGLAGTSVDLAAHIADATAAHAATAVSFTPAGAIAATTVQAAIEEVASEGAAPDMTALQAYMAASATGAFWLADPSIHGVVASAGGDPDTSTPMLTLTLATATVEISAGAVLVENTADPARVWFWYFPTSENLFAQFAAPDPTDPRVDMIVAQVIDTATGEAELQVIEGVPAPIPDEPEIPADSEVLYSMTIPAGETDAANWTPEDQRDIVTTVLDFSSEIENLLDDIVLLQGDFSSEHASLDQEVTDTTLVTHGELGTGCEAGFQWHFSYHIFLLSDGAAEGVKLAITGTAGLGSFGITAQVTIYDDTLNTFATGRITALDTAFGAALSSGQNHAVIEGVADLNVGGSTGTIQLAFAQNATGANAGVHVQVNSSSIFTRLASSS